MHFEPKSFGLVVSVSLVCESKAGFSIKVLTNTDSILRICPGWIFSSACLGWVT